jgi:hypothetical protein
MRQHASFDFHVHHAGAWPFSLDRSGYDCPVCVLFGGVEAEVTPCAGDHTQQFNLSMPAGVHTASHPLRNDDDAFLSVENVVVDVLLLAMAPM